MFLWGGRGENILHFILARQSNRRPKSPLVHPSARHTNLLLLWILNWSENKTSFCIYLFAGYPLGAGQLRPKAKAFTVTVTERSTVPPSTALRGGLLKH